MKTLRIITSITLLILTAAFIISCGSVEDKLPGTWITESVTANIDSTKATPSDLAKIENTINSQKMMKFVLNEDHTMALSVDESTFDAFWSVDDENTIRFTFVQGATAGAIDLGTYKGGEIVYTGDIKHGTITSVYIKE